MSVNAARAEGYAATAGLAHFAAGLTFENLPEPVRRRMSALLVDFFRVAVVGTRTPWGGKLAGVLAGLGGAPEASILYSDRRMDVVRATYLNGVIAGSLEWDDTHVGAMLHPGVTVWPAVLAIGELVDAPGPRLVAAAAAGYETMIRIGLSVQPAHFRRGFQSTATIGVFGAAVAAARLLDLGETGIRDALGIAGSYAGGVTQFFLSGSEVKRLHAGHAASAGVEAALFAHAGLSGPPDVLEGRQGFARAMAGAFDGDRIEHGLGTEWHLLRLQLKPHAASARVLAAAEAAEALVADGVSAGEVASIRIGVPKVIVGRLTGNDPRDLQQAQMSAPFAVAATLALAPERPHPLTLSVEDFETCLTRPEVIALSRATECVLDEEIERLSTTEYVAARVTLTLRSGAIREAVVPIPAGSPERPMEAGELRARFRAVAAGKLPDTALDGWLALAEHPERIRSARDLMSLRLPEAGRPA